MLKWEASDMGIRSWKLLSGLILLVLIFSCGSLHAEEIKTINVMGKEIDCLPSWKIDKNGDYSCSYPTPIWLPKDVVSRVEDKQPSEEKPECCAKGFIDVGCVESCEVKQPSEEKCHCPTITLKDGTIVPNGHGPYDKCCTQSSRRSEFLEKCDFWIKKLDVMAYDGKAKTSLVRTASAIATAYCLRASLEKESK